jgi:hypothetical protein
MHEQAEKHSIKPATLHESLGVMEHCLQACINKLSKFCQDSSPDLKNPNPKLKAKNSAKFEEIRGQKP